MIIQKAMKKINKYTGKKNKNKSSKCLHMCQVRSYFIIIIEHNLAVDLE